MSRAPDPRRTGNVFFAIYFPGAVLGAGSLVLAAAGHPAARPVGVVAVGLVLLSLLTLVRRTRRPGP